MEKIWNLLVTFYRWIRSLMRGDSPQPTVIATTIPKPAKLLALYEGREFTFDTGKIAEALKLTRRVHPKTGEAVVYGVNYCGRPATTILAG